MRSATLDTNLLQEYWKNQARRATVERLIELARTGELSLAVTARVREDISTPPLSDLIETLDVIGVEEIGSVTRLGYWVLGRDMLGSDHFVQVSEDVKAAFQAAGRKAPDWRDWDHVHSHFLTGRDVFLTWDKAILGVGPELNKRLGIVVMVPEELLKVMTTSVADAGD